MRSASISRRPSTQFHRVGLIVLAVLAGSSTSIAAIRPEGERKTIVAIIDGKEMPVPAISMGDPATIDKIIDEGKNRSQVMQHLEHLTKKIGPRLTGSSNLEKANNWCKDQYESWGLTNAHLEEWGTIATRFDRGPCSGKLLTANGTGFDTALDLEFTTYSWSIGTNGPVRGPVVKLPKTEEEYAAVKDKLKGAWVLIPEGDGSGQRRASAIGARYLANIEARKEVADKKVEISALPVDDRILFDGINGFIARSGGREPELVITSSIPTPPPPEGSGNDRRGPSAWRSVDVNNIPPDINITVRKTHYDEIVKRMEANENFQLEFDLKHTFTPGPIKCYNTIAEIRGTEWPEQVVVVSGHLDSWDGPGSEGCTDNGTGTATTLEAARILAAVGAKPKRTIRFIDWSGEEQGLLGSAAYVDAHKDDIVKNVSACLVDDGGTNYCGGLPAAQQMVDMLAAATAPINNVFYSETDQKYLNVNIRPLKRTNGDASTQLRVSGGSDHMSFNRVGVPGFFWDETGRANYTHTHHTQFDKLDQAIPEYLMQSATCAAVTAYNLACADTLLPRSIRDPVDENAPQGNRPPRRYRRILP